MRLVGAQEFDLYPEVFILLEAVPVTESDIGASSVTQTEDKPRVALVHFRVVPETFDALYVAAGKPFEAALQRVEHVTELIDSADGGKPCSANRFLRHTPNLVDRIDA